MEFLLLLYSLAFIVNFDHVILGLLISKISKACANSYKNVFR